MKNYLVLVLLLISGILFFSCNESEVIDYSLPVRSELPLCRYAFSSIYSTNKEAVNELLRRDAIVIRSKADLEDCLNEMENLYDKDFRKKYPEYTSVDFSKYTMIVHCFLDPYNPANLARSKSFFCDSVYAPYEFKPENAFYCYIQQRDYYAGDTASDKIQPLIYVSGIVVDKIPANEKVAVIVSFSQITSKK